MQTHEWEALLDGLEGVTLAAGHQTFLPFDDDPDQSPVDLPCVWITGMEGRWSNIGAPGELVPVLAASIDSVAEVIRLRKAIAAMRDRHLAQIAAASYITDDVLDAQFIADDLTRVLEGEA